MSHHRQKSATDVETKQNYPHTEKDGGGDVMMILSPGRGRVVLAGGLGVGGILLFLVQITVAALPLPMSFPLFIAH